jgi:hypothetical protein
MSILDAIRAKVSGLFDGSGNEVAEDLDTVRALPDMVTGGNGGEQVEDGIQQAKDGVQPAKEPLSGS